MATTTATKKTAPAGVPSAEQVSAQVREITDRVREQTREQSEQFLAAAKTVGNRALDAYEEAASTVLQLRAKAVESVDDAEWLPSIVPAAVKANVQFAEDVNAAYLKAARAILA